MDPSLLQVDLIGRKVDEIFANLFSISFFLASCTVTSFLTAFEPVCGSNSPSVHLWCYIWTHTVIHVCVCISLRVHSLRFYNHSSELHSKRILPGHTSRTFTYSETSPLRKIYIVSTVFAEDPEKIYFKIWIKIRLMAFRLRYVTKKQQHIQWNEWIVNTLLLNSSFSCLPNHLILRLVNSIIAAILL